MIGTRSAARDATECRTPRRGTSAGQRNYDLLTQVFSNAGRSPGSARVKPIVADACSKAVPRHRYRTQNSGDLFDHGQFRWYMPARRK